MNHKSPLVALNLLFPALALLLSACEEPRQRSEAPAPGVQAAPPPGASTPSPAEASPAEGTTETEVPPVETPSEDDLPEAEPEFSVAMEGDRILVSGALRSKIQVERIVESLALEFPDHRIESTLKVEYHRIPVGWGNRIVSEFLATYLREAAEPRVTYKDTVLTLEGKVRNPGIHRHLTEIAVDAFSGSSTESIDNRIVVEGSAAPGGEGKGRREQKGKP